MPGRTSYGDLYPDLYPPDLLPQVQVQAQFTPGTWTDITAYMRSFDIQRPSTRLQGPLWQYQAGTASITLKNGDGRFDPDNLAGPFTSATSLRQVVWVLGAGQSKTWVAPRNLSGTTVKVEAWGPGANGADGFTGTAGAGGEYAAENTYPVIPGQSYAAVAPAGNSGSAATFDGTGVVAHAASGTTPGSGSSNSIHFPGGAPGAGGTLSGSGIGGGGGSSGGNQGAGNPGTAGNSGGAGGPAPAGGYGGGNGAPNPKYRGQSGQGPGGGGGGGAITSFAGLGQRISVSAGGFGKGGQVRLTYFVTITPSATVTQVLPMVPVQVTATWNSVTYPLFTGFADSWTDAGLNNPRYAETVLAATDGFKALSGNTIAALGSPLGAGDDSGTRADRILDWAGWPPTQRQLDAGDTTQQATSFGSDALSLLQLTADTEIGECYVNGSGNLVFRHRRAILSDTRSAYPQAVFGDQPGTLAPQVTWHGDGVHGGSPFFITITGGPQFFPAATAASKQMWVWSSVPYPAGVQLVMNFSDATLTFISSASGPVTAIGTTPVLLSVSGTSPANTAFMNVQPQVQGIPASSVIFFAQAAPPLDANDVTMVPVLTPWAAGFNTTIATLGNWSPSAGVPGELPYANVSRANDDTTLANDIQITAAGSSNVQEVTDPVSVYVYQSERSWVRTDLLLPDDATAFQYANWVLYVSKNSEDRFDVLAMNPRRNPAALFPQVLGRDIGDRIQVWRTPPGVPARVTKDVFIRGITHSFDVSTQAWLTTWTLQSATRYGGFMTLDSAVSGLLDIDALAY